MIEPTLDDLGRRVIYRDMRAGKIEEGTLTSFNRRYVFVRYGHGSTSAATARSELEWSDRLASETSVRTCWRGGRIVELDFCQPTPDSALTQTREDSDGR